MQLITLQQTIQCVFKPFNESIIGRERISNYVIKLRFIKDAIFEIVSAYLVNLSS